MLQDIARVSVTAIQPDAMGASGSCLADFLGGTTLRFTSLRALVSIGGKPLRPTFALTFACLVATALLAQVGSSVISADNDDRALEPGNLVVSRSVYDNNPSNVTVGQNLPVDCTAGNCVTALWDGAFPTVYNNAPIDGSFGITSKILLDELTPHGQYIKTLAIPTSAMVTSFSSKSEMALNLSADRQILTLMGYFAPIDAIDVSNTNTPGVVDATNPVPQAVYRVIAELDRSGHLHYTLTNAYSGNNGRAAWLNNKAGGEGVFYLSGNAGNGSNPEPTNILLAAGAQIETPSDLPEALQNPGTPTPVGSFNITQLPVNPTKLALGFNPVDKIGKDDNFRGLTVFDDVVYFSKGSGGNGVNTVYFVDTTGLVCPQPATGQLPTATSGTGLPMVGAALPIAPLVFPAPLTNPPGLPSNMCVLAGFPTNLAKTATLFPFGLWFANATTLYVADEGDGTTTYNAATNTYTHAAGQTTAGLQKWVLDPVAKQWNFVYTLQAGLNLGVPYTVKNYPVGPNGSGTTGLPWSPATDGLRNLTGRVNEDGTATIWAITSTVSGSGDQGADPNSLVMITDTLSAQTLPANEQFKTLETAGFAQVLRGVSFTPGTHDHNDDQGHDHH